jgi:hypothetical protein
MVELLDLCSTRAALTPLILERAAAGVVEEEVLRGDKLESTYEVVFEERYRVELVEKVIVCEQTFHDVFAVKMNTANPSEMIQTNVLGAHLACRYT